MTGSAPRAALVQARLAEAVPVAESGTGKHPVIRFDDPVRRGGHDSALGHGNAEKVGLTLAGAVEAAVDVSTCLRGEIAELAAGTRLVIAEAQPVLVHEFHLAVQPVT